MSNALARLKSRLQEQGIDPSLLAELEDEYADLSLKGGGSATNVTIAIKGNKLIIE